MNETVFGFMAVAAYSAVLLIPTILASHYLLLERKKNQQLLTQLRQCQQQLAESSPSSLGQSKPLKQIQEQTEKTNQTKDIH